MHRLEKWLNTSWVPFVCFSIVAFLIYGFSLFFDLTFLDDNIWLNDYRWYLKDINRVFTVFKENDVLFGQLFYRPMIYVSFILDTQWAGKGFFSYHWTNIWLHIFNTTLVFYLFQQFDFKRATAFAGSMLFLTHPVFVSAVAWVPGRTDTLMAFFLFASFLCFMRWSEKKRLGYLAGHILFLLGALLTKETAVITPMFFVLYVWIFSRQGKWKIKTGLLMVMWGLLIGGYLLIRQGGVHEQYDSSLSAMVISLWHNLPSLVPYVGKCLLPFNLSVLPVLEDLTFVYGFITLAVLSALTWFTKNKRPAVLFFGVTWFVFLIVPSLVFSFLKHEYRLYVPMFGFLLVILELLRSREKHLQGMFAVCLVFACLSLWHSSHYHDRFAFWLNAVKTSPHSPLAQRNLGAMYFIDGKYLLAEKRFEDALKLNPEERMCYNNLGLIYEMRGEHIRAEDAYIKEIEINPYYDNVHYNLGLFYYKMGYYDNSVALWERTIELNPRYKAAYSHLFSHFMREKDYQRAFFYANKLKEQGEVIPPKILQTLQKHMP